VVGVCTVRLRWGSGSLPRSLGRSLVASSLVVRASALGRIRFRTPSLQNHRCGVFVALLYPSSGTRFRRAFRVKENFL